VSESNVRVALVGIGYISDFHLAAARRVPGAQVVGICDLSRSRAERLASQNPGLQVYTDVGALISEQGPTAIHVLTPPQAHVGLTQQILGSGVAAFVESYHGWLYAALGLIGFLVLLNSPTMGTLGWIALVALLLTAVVMVVHRLRGPSPHPAAT